MATGAAGAVELDREALLGMYEKMMQIRTFEDLAGKNFAAGLVPVSFIFTQVRRPSRSAFAPI